jgi:hypothetical protein
MNVVTLAERMRILYNGNVGIGTTSPAALLHLAVANASVDGTKGVRITNPAGTTVMLECGVSNDSFVGTTSVSDFHIRTGNTERMRITSGGNVLIGTSSDLGLTTGGILQVNNAYGMSITNGGQALRLFRSGVNTWEFGQGTFTSQTGFGLTDATASKTALFIQQTTCNVGIGTTSPSAKLEVSGAGYIVKATATGSDSSYFQAVNGSYDYIAGIATSLGYGLMGMNSNHSLAIMTNGAERMRITSGGDVGIGTTSPGAKLHVVGNEYIAKVGGGGTYKQTVVGQTTAAGSGVAKKIVYVGYSHSIRVYLFIKQTDSDVATATADFATAYGASSGGITYSSRLGNISSISAAYNNGGSPAYTIDVTVNYTGAAPTINYVIEGVNNDNNIYTI